MNKHLSRWKRVIVMLLAATMVLAACSFAGAQETEETQRTTLNIVDAESDADETESADETADAKEAELPEETEMTEETELAEEAETAVEPKTAEEAELTEEAETAAEPRMTEEAKSSAGMEEDQPSTKAQIPAVESVSGTIVTTDVSEIVENCMPSIVAITNISVEEVESYYYGTMEFEAESTASGIIISQSEEELLIATNNHVVSDAKELTVCFSVEADNEEDLVVPAKLKGADSAYELAVIAVQMSDIPDSVREQLRVANLGSSGDLKVGQAAIAIGNALGYGQSVTVGIISTLDRPVTIDNFSMDVILTDAAINYGNSGSALLNAAGEVIGICVAKETGESAEGMGYAIPIDTAIPVLEQMVNKETRDKLSNSQRGYIGASVLEVSEEAVTNYGMPAGAFVYEVSEGSAAEKAGIQRGDIITKIQGESVTSSDDLIAKMSYYAPGETITLEVQTANNGSYEARDVEVTLQEGEASEEDEEEEEIETPEDDSDESAGSWFGDDWDDGFDGWFYGFDDDFDYGFDDGFDDYNSQFEFH